MYVSNTHIHTYVCMYLSNTHTHIVLGASHLILYIEYIIQGSFPLEVDCYTLIFYHSQDVGS
jgi:hypothetical protein